MVFSDIIDNFIAPLFIDQQDCWDFVMVDLEVIEGDGLESVKCDSMDSIFMYTIFDLTNWEAGWPSGRYDNYVLVPDCVELKPRDQFGRYTVKGVLISPWLLSDLPMAEETLDILKITRPDLYAKVKGIVYDQRLPFA